jgi:hypothetical protein
MTHPLNTENNIRCRAVEFLRLQTVVVNNLNDFHAIINAIRAEIDLSDKTSPEGQQLMSNAMNSLKFLKKGILAARANLLILRTMDYVPNLRNAGSSIHTLPNTPEEANWLVRHSMAEVEMRSQTSAITADLNSTDNRMNALLDLLAYMSSMVEEVRSDRLT